MASHQGSGESGSTKSPKVTKGSSKAPRSQKLGRTLKELESAFHDWESLSTAKVSEAAAVESSRKAKVSEKNELEFRKKTKKLLSQLRQQLSELNE